MGLGLGAITLLLEEDRRRPLLGRILTLGRQTVSPSPQRLAEILTRFGKPVPVGGVVDDEALFHAIGFSEVVSVDVNDFEHPTQLLDLNEPETPADLVGGFDVVLDGGTLEHVFHLPNALAQIGRMVKPGGRIIHFAPSSNYFDHGFYMFSPTLFVDYYRANGGQIETAKIIRHRADNARWDIFDYDTAAWRRTGVGGLDGCAYLIFTVVTAGPTRAQKTPSQSHYVDVWQAGSAAEARRGLRSLLARLPGGLAMARQLRSVVRLAATGTIFGKRPVARIPNG